MEAGLRPMQRIRSCTQLLDESRRPNDGLKNRFEERAIR